MIFMDFEMPKMNGIECTIKLKQMMEEGTISEIPIIGLTAYNDE